MFAGILSRIGTVSRRRGVFASSCISEHRKVHKQTSRAHEANFISQFRSPFLSLLLLSDVFRRNIYS